MTTERKLIPFDIERVRAGEAVEARDESLQVRVVCCDRIHELLPVVALVKKSDGSENLLEYTSKGEYPDTGSLQSRYDLFMAPKKRSGWVNVYGNKSKIITSEVFLSKEEAYTQKKYSVYTTDIFCYIATTDIHWEE